MRCKCECECECERRCAGEQVGCVGGVCEVCECWMWMCRWAGVWCGCVR